MPNDAKLGLLSGVAAVLVAAVAYYQKPVAAEPADKPVAAGTRAVPPGMPPVSLKVPAKSVSRANADLDD